MILQTEVGKGYQKSTRNSNKREWNDFLQAIYIIQFPHAQSVYHHHHHKKGNGTEQNGACDKDDE